MFYLIDFDDGYVRDILPTMIVSPRQEEYYPGDRVVSRCPAFPGVWGGTIRLVNDDRSVLKAIAIKENAEKEKEAKQSKGKQSKGKQSKVKQSKGKKRTPSEERREKRETPGHVFADNTESPLKELEPTGRVLLPLVNTMEYRKGDTAARLEALELMEADLDDSREDPDYKAVEEASGNSSGEEVSRPAKKQKVQKGKENLDIAKVAKKTLQEVKRKKERAREETRASLSFDILGGSGGPGAGALATKADILGDSGGPGAGDLATKAEVDALRTEVQGLKEAQETMIRMIESFLSSCQCRECTKRLYVRAKAANPTPTPLSPPTKRPKPVAGPSTGHDVKVAANSVLPFETPLSPVAGPSTEHGESVVAAVFSQEPGSTKPAATPLSPQPADRSAKPTAGPSGCVEGLPASGDGERLVVDCQDSKPDAGEGLAYLGDARYGIRVDAAKLERCIATSKKVDKLALKLLEIVITDQEIKDCTISGHGKKDAINANKRKALRSELYSHYMTKESSETIEDHWKGTIVTKLTDKIRAMRNNKYPRITENKYKLVEGYSNTFYSPA